MFKVLRKSDDADTKATKSPPKTPLPLSEGHESNRNSDAESKTLFVGGGNPQLISRVPQTRSHVFFTRGRFALPRRSKLMCRRVSLQMGQQ